MAGLLTPSNAPQESAKQPPQSSEDVSAASLSDPILKQIEQGIEDKIPPEMKDAYLRIVVAGMQIMFSKETSQLLDKTLEMPGDPVSNISQGVAKLLVLVYNESKKSPDQEGMDVRMAVPAAIALGCQALDYAEHTKGLKMTPEMAAQMTKETMSATLKAFGITDDQVNQTIQAGQQQGGAQDQGAPPAAVPQQMTGA